MSKSSGQGRFWKILDDFGWNFNGISYRGTSKLSFTRTSSSEATCDLDRHPADTGHVKDVADEVGHIDDHLNIQHGSKDKLRVIPLERTCCVDTHSNRTLFGRDPKQPVQEAKVFSPQSRAQSSWSQVADWLV